MRITKEKWDKLVALAGKLANISRACEQLGISRSLYYKWIKTVESSPAYPSASTSTRRRHPHSIPLEVKNEFLAIAQAQPDWGCQRISYFLELKGEKARGKGMRNVHVTQRVQHEMLSHFVHAVKLLFNPRTSPSCLRTPGQE